MLSSVQYTLGRTHNDIVPPRITTLECNSNFMSDAMVLALLLPTVSIYILLDVLVGSIAVYFYELCGILTSP